jgi:2-dehydro-3-deoxygluconokinase
VAAQLYQKFKLKYVSITLRESHSATVNDWSGMLYDGKRYFTSRKYHIDYIVDRIGGGDAYSSGIIYGLLTDQDLQETVEFAAAASCLKHTIHGDFNLATFDEIVALIRGDGSGRIQR